MDGTDLNAVPQKGDAIPAAEENVLDRRSENDLLLALRLAEHTVYKKYLAELKYYPLLMPGRELLNQTPSLCDRFCLLDELSCEKGEDLQQKLSTVYHASMSLGCTLALIIDAPGNHAPVQIYLGVHNADGLNAEAKQRLLVSYQTLANGMRSNFSGTRLHSVSAQEEFPALLDDIFGEINSNVASVSCVASSRDKTKTENKAFIQGIERLIDTMRGNAYTALFIAEPISEAEQSRIRSGYESLYTTLSPFAKSVWSYQESESNSVMRSVTEGLSKSITTGSSDTQSHNTTKGISIGVNASGQKTQATGRSETTTDSTHYSETKQSKGTKVLKSAGSVLGFVGGVALNMLLPVAGAAVGSLFSNGINGLVAPLGKAQTTSTSNSSSTTSSISDAFSKMFGASVSANFSVTNGTAHTESESQTTQKSESKTEGTTDTRSKGRTLQTETVNKQIGEMLTRIDDQLRRSKEGEDYGAYSVAAYFLSGKEANALLAANTYRALMLGEGSSVESGAINTWSDPAFTNGIKEYLRRFTHPLFLLSTKEEPETKDDVIFYSPGTVVSGLELPLHLGLPMRSVNGLPVIEHAQFGRNVVSMGSGKQDDDVIELGSIFHMNQKEATPVSLSLQSLSSHVFITGSTGSGKSNAVYQMLGEIRKKNVRFLVVEPAKGEYKDAFADQPDVSVYGTNPLKTPLLRIDPFAFPEDIHVLEHLDRLIEIFNVCWPMYAAMPAVLKNAVEQAYTDCGWDLISSENALGERLFPSFADVARNVKKIIDSSEYDNENKGAYKGSLLTRLQSLTNGINGLIFTSDAIADEALFDENVIVDISRVGSGETKSLIMGLMVLKLQEYRSAHARGGNQRLKHVTVLEEAHNILRRAQGGGEDRGSLTTKSVELLSNAIAEMRTYGEGFFLVDQSPGLLDMAAIRNTNTKVILRLPDQSDRDLVGLAAALNRDQITELAKLPTGVAAVYQNEWLQPVLCGINRYRTGTQLYRCAPETRSAPAADPAARLRIAEWLSSCRYMQSAEEMNELRTAMRAAGLPASARASARTILTTPGGCTRMTKLAPLMAALFPQVCRAVAAAYADAREPEKWTEAAKQALENDVGAITPIRLYADIVQGVVTYCVLQEANDLNALKLWTEKGKLL